MLWSRSGGNGGAVDQGLLVAGDTIVPVPFLKNMGHLVAHITCGNNNAGQDATDWIQGIGARHVRNELNAKTQVWLYKNRMDNYVGFGSLGKASWRLNQQPQIIQLIPMLGLFEQYQGLPLPGSGDLKYCKQLLNHLLDEAHLRSTISRWVGLSVRKDNVRAIALYEMAGFQWLKNDKGLNRMLLWIG